MKIKKFMFFTGLLLALVTLMSSECNKDATDPSCDGYASATATGEVSNTFCFDTLYQFNYDGESVSFGAGQTGVTHYGMDFFISPCSGTGTYNCGIDQPGGLELIIHGDNNEFYKSQSGTITITKIDNSHVEATFDVVTAGYYNNKTVNLKGSVYRASN